MDKKEIGRLLMKLRGDRTQREVAESVNVTDGAIRHYEAGRRLPKDKIKADIADYFGVSVDYLFFSFIIDDHKNDFRN